MYCILQCHLVDHLYTDNCGKQPRGHEPSSFSSKAWSMKWGIMFSCIVIDAIKNINKARLSVGYYSIINSLSFGWSSIDWSSCHRAKQTRGHELYSFSSKAWSIIWGIMAPYLVRDTIKKIIKEVLKWRLVFNNN